MQTSAKARLGTRFTCFQCGTKFYDLNRDPSCPECGADQRQAPVRDLKALLGSGKSRKRARAYEEDEEDVEVPSDDDDSSDDDDYGLLDDDDDDDSGDGDDYDSDDEGYGDDD